MVIYTREEKVLIIPEGEGCGCQGGGGHPSRNCEREKREAYESGYTAGLQADCGEAIDEAYNSGYTAGLEACSGSTDCSSAVTEAYQSGITEGMAEQKALLSSTAITTNGTYTNENGWNSVNVNVPRFMPAEEKTLSLVEHSTGPWEVVASYPIGMSKVTVEDNGYGQGKYDEGYADGLADCSGSTDCSSAITEAYQSGYTAGLADCSGSSCTFEEGELDISDFWDGGPTVVYPFTADGFSQFTVEDTNGSYAHKHYMDGYNDGLAQCSGSTDCSSAVTEAYQSGYTEGYNEGYDDALYEKCDLETTLIVVPSGSTGIMNDITPTEAAGFGSVSVNATEYGEWKYQSGYTEGYQSGYTQGQADCDCSEAYNLGYNDGYEDGRESVTSGCPMQEKSISLSSIEESVSPDYGYAGLSEVHINAQSFYNTAYNDGYAAGLEDCSGSTDCSSAITEAYQSGYTEGHASGYTEGYNQGQADCPQCSGGTCNLEASQVTLGYDWTGFTRVYPSQGYDGLSDVIVADIGYGQRKYDEGYTEGHASGYTEGYNAAITANCGSAITEAYESGYTEGYDAAGTKIYSSSKDIYFDEFAWVDVESSTAYSEEDTIMIDYKWGNTVTGSNTIVLFSNESDDPTAANPPSPTTPSFSILMHTAGLSITTDDGQGNRQIWTGLYRSAQANHSYRLIVQTYSYTSSVTIKAALIDLTSGQITTGSTNGAFHFTGATSLNYCINGYRNTVDGVYQGMNTDWYLGGIKIFDNTGVMKHNYHFLNGCISDVVNDLETGYEAKYYDGAVETTYSLTGVEETMRFFY